MLGCGGQDGTGGIGRPRRGGRLRAAFAGAGAQETLDPHRANLFADAARAKALFDKLADCGSDVSAQPRLAKAWESSKDLRTWRVTLREASFHDGKSVRAADVLYSYRRITDPKRAFRAKADLEPIDLVKSRAVSAREIEFVLKSPLADFPQVLAAFGAYIVPEGADDFAEPVGSGPFEYVSFEPGRSALFKRFDDYWERPAYLDELEIVVSNDESGRMNALVGGQVEYAHDLTATTARAHKKTEGVTVVSLPRSGMHALAMKVDRAPFDDVDVRRAMMHFVDREQLVSTVLSGQGEVGNDLFGKGYEYYADDVPQRQHDVDKAKWHLRRAGATKLEVTLLTSSVASGFIESASLLKDQARAAGVTLNVVTGNKDTYWSDILDRGALASYRSGAMPIGHPHLAAAAA